MGRLERATVRAGTSTRQGRRDNRAAVDTVSSSANQQPLRVVGVDDLHDAISIPGGTLRMPLHPVVDIFN